MRRVVVARHGGPEVLEIHDVETPAPAPGQVLVRHSWVGVNFVDVMYRRGGDYHVDLPCTPGVEAAGVVEAVGHGVEGVNIGDRVTYTGFHNASYAEAGLVPAASVLPTPRGIDDRTAAAVAMQGGTAAVLLTMAQSVSPGDVVVVTAAGGGVGAFLTQAATAMGARVVAQASSPEKAAYAEQSGAERVVRNYVDLSAAVDELTDGKGAVAAFDAVGQAAAESVLACLAVRGHYVLYGKTSGPITGFDLDRLSGFQGDHIRGAARVSWVSGYHYLQERSEALAVQATLARWVGDGVIRPRVAAEFELAEVADAHRALEERSLAGKVLLRIGN